MEKRSENKMGVMPIGKLVLNMSLPIMLSMLMQAMYNVVDSVYVSRLSEAALTAVSLSFPAQTLMIALATGTGVGVNALLSRALGAKEDEKANRVAENGVFLAAVGYAVFLLFGLFAGRAFVSAQTSNPQIIGYAVNYLTIVCCCSFGLFGQSMFERLMQSTGRTVYTLFTQGLGAVINIILDPICIFTLNMGVEGAAVATVIGQVIAFAIAVTLNHKRNPEIHLQMRKFKPDFALIRQIYAIGFPSVLMIAIGSVMTFLMNIILINFTSGRETTATVFGIYFKLNSFAFMPVYGLNSGVIPIIAYNYGAKNRERMMKTVKVAVGFALGIMTVGFLLFMFVPELLLEMFDANEMMMTIGVPALRIIGTTFPVAGACIAMGSIFQALGRGIYSMWVSFARQILVLVPSAWVFAQIGLRVGNDDLVWLSFPVAEVVSLAVTVLLFIRIYKKIIRDIPAHGH